MPGPLDRFFPACDAPFQLDDLEEWDHATLLPEIAVMGAILGSSWTIWKRRFRSG
jgi:hypothetical protein